MYYEIWGGGSNGEGNLLLWLSAVLIHPWSVRCLQPFYTQCRSATRAEKDPLTGVLFKQAYGECCCTSCALRALPWHSHKPPASDMQTASLHVL